jgi:hypothetical protein
MPLRRGKRRLIRRDDTYTADEDVELEPVAEDPAIVPESEQVGDLDHEGAPDGGN